MSDFDVRAGVTDTATQGAGAGNTGLYPRPGLAGPAQPSSSHEIRTCSATLDHPGVCCHDGGLDLWCHRPARYAVLYGYTDELVEHLRCVEHAAAARERSGNLVAMKDYCGYYDHPAEQVGRG